MFRFGAVAFTAILLAACASTTVRLPPSLSTSANPNTMGVVAGSMGMKKGGAKDHAGAFALVALGVRPVGHPDQQFSITYAVPDMTVGRKAEFDLADVHESTFATRLPEGRYEIYQARFYMSFYPIERSCEAKQEMSVPFDVKRAQTTYLGEFVANGEWGKSLIGIPVVGCGYFVIRDQAQRDIAALRAKNGIVGNVVPALPRQMVDTALERNFLRVPRV